MRPWVTILVMMAHLHASLPSLQLYVDSNDVKKLLVYLRTTPEVVHSRMVKRGRSEEAGVPMAYLQQVHKYYEKWLLEHQPRAPPAPVLIIDADQELEAVKRDYELKKSVIMGEKPL